MPKVSKVAVDFDADEVRPGENQMMFRTCKEDRVVMNAAAKAMHMNLSVFCRTVVVQAARQVVAVDARKRA